MIIVIKKGTPLEEIKQQLKNLKPKKVLKTKKYLGVIKLKESPLEIQKKMRGEW